MTTAPRRSLPTALGLVALASALVVLGCPPTDLPVAISEGSLDSILDVCTKGAPTEDCTSPGANLGAFFGDGGGLCLRQHCDDDACGGSNNCPANAAGKNVRAAVRVALVARLGGDGPQAIALSACIELGAQADAALDSGAFSDEFSRAVDGALAGGLWFEDFEGLEDAYVLLGFFTWLEAEPSPGLGTSDGCVPDRLRVASELTLAADGDTLDVSCASCLTSQSAEFPSHCLDRLLKGSASGCFFDAVAEVLGVCDPGGAWVTSTDAGRCEATVD